MKSRLEHVVGLIEEKNELHAKKVRKNVASGDGQFAEIANALLDSYCAIFEPEGKGLEYAVDCYLQMISDMMYEQLRFIESGRYSSCSFEEVNQRVYADPSIMEYYMHGLILSQVLWRHHYSMLRVFMETIPRFVPTGGRYLEIGGGHGLFLSQAIRLTREKGVCFDLVDISATSLDLARKFVNDDSVNYCLSDIFKFQGEKKYDFITMGEVLEHVEDPHALMQKLHSLLNDDGYAFITVPGNAPAIDHIYLFNNVDELITVIEQSGFEIIEKTVLFAEDAPQEVLERMKIAFLFGGVLRKKTGD